MEKNLAFKNFFYKWTKGEIFYHLGKAWGYIHHLTPISRHLRETVSLDMQKLWRHLSRRAEIQALSSESKGRFKSATEWIKKSFVVFQNSFMTIGDLCDNFLVNVGWTKLSLKIGSTFWHLDRFFCYFALFFICEIESVCTCNISRLMKILRSRKLVILILGNVLKRQKDFEVTLDL